MSDGDKELVVCKHLDLASAPTTSSNQLLSPMQTSPSACETIQTMSPSPEPVSNVTSRESLLSRSLSSLTRSLTPTDLKSDLKRESPPPSPADTNSPNWQSNKTSIRHRNAAMFLNSLISDVTFVVGDQDTCEEMPAHKYVLATGSSVFYSMFYGGLAESRKVIEIPDVEPAAFKVLLRYLYCDCIELSAENVLGTLYAAEKYAVGHMVRECVTFLKKNLTAQNACLILTCALRFNEDDLTQRCWEVIDAQAEMAVQSDDFVEINLAALRLILSRETLNCTEISLFHAARAWAKADCLRRSISPTPQKQRAALADCLYLIRFPVMTLQQMADEVVEHGILTADEMLSIFLHFTASKKPAINFPIKPRTGLTAQICHRFQTCAYRSNQWRYRGRCDSIQFSVDKRIFVVGLGLYGSSNGPAEYTATVELKSQGQVLAKATKTFFSDGSSNTFHLYLEHPVQVEPDNFYTASAVLEGSELSYFGQEGLSEVYMGTVTFHFQCSSESTNGTGVQGGQIPEIIYYGPTVHRTPTTTTASTTD